MALLGSNETVTQADNSGLRKEPALRNLAPIFNANSFECPRCSVVATQRWIDFYQKSTAIQQNRTVRVETKMEDVGVSQCGACGGRALWFEKKLIFPAPTVAEPTPANMPVELQIDFEEARAVAPSSPRAAAALLRMCIEGLCKNITGETKFDTAMKKLEAQGVPKQITMAMDVIRLNGNEVLHAGKLYGDDNSATVALMFGLVKNIVNWAITEKKQLEELYAQIPPEKRKHIEERGAKGKMP